MKSSRLLFLASLLICLSTAPGFAGTATGPESADRSGQQDRRFERLQQALQLTPEQQAQLRTIMASRRETSAPLREQQRTLRQNLHELSQAEAFDAEQVRQQLHAAVDARVDLMAARHAARQEIAAVLSTEQQIRWRQLREQRQTRGGQRHHDRRCTDPGPGGPGQ